MKPSVDIVIPTVRDLDFLEDWRELLCPYNLIIVQDGDPSRLIKIPDGFTYKLFTREDIERDLGDDAWIISRNDSACRSYGFLKARARYVFTFDDDCSIVSGVDPVLCHVRNLTLPSYPTYYNPLIDCDYARGYPYSRRSGALTVISQGLCVNVPDLDAPTQMAAAIDRLPPMIEGSPTIPRGVYFSMRGMNLAFDRSQIGIAMYFGLMGQDEPIGRYGDLWAGWCAKAVCDHLRLGVKCGNPYVSHDRARDWRLNLPKEMNGLLWQDEIISFFERMRFPSVCTTSALSYLWLSKQVEKHLAHIEAGYFKRLSSAMMRWSSHWQRQNPI